MLKIIAFNNRSTNEIQLAFNQDLNTSIGISNIRVSSDIPSISDLEIKSIIVQGNVLAITCSPQVPMVNYFIELFSTDFQSFGSIDGDLIQEDNTNNRVYFLGLEISNTVRDSMLEATPPVYDVTTHTIVRKHISNLAEQIFKSQTEVKKLGNANYIYETITDERKERAFGPTDRLDNASAFEILRVSTTPTGTTTSGKLEFNNNVLKNLLGDDSNKGNQLATRMGSDPVSLRFTTATELVSNLETEINKFDGLTISLANKNVARINSIVLNTEGGNTYVYDIRNYKYSILDNRHDSINANRLSTLSSNQFKLSESAIISLNFAVPSGADELIINYTYIDNGINVDQTTILISKLIDVIREPVGAFQTVFSLRHFPIVNSLDQNITLDGISFLDPNPTYGLPFSNTHPAFINEIPYSTSRLPSYAGEYSVDYATGRVFVYGEVTNDGTGDTPPVASYIYRKEFVENVDYSFDPDTDEVVAIAGRDIANNDVKITFLYEKVLVPGIDYIAKTHVEAINEYVDNRFTAPDKISTLNYPVTDVYEVINETTGEQYNITRFDDYNIFISGRSLPTIKQAQSEIATFKRISNEELFIIEDVISYGGGQKAIKTQFANRNIVSALGNMLASSVNNSVTFSDFNIFKREMFYDSILQNLSQNLNKLTTLGDYAIDFSTGEVYIRVLDDQESSLGFASYTYGSIDPVHSNVTSVNSVIYQHSNGLDAVYEVTVEDTGAESITTQVLPSSTERFLLDNTDKPILLGMVQHGVVGQTVLGGFTFTAPDALFNASHDDGYHILRIPGDPDRAIVTFISSTQVVVDIAFDETNRTVPWCLINTTLSDGYNCTTSYDIDFVRGVYTVTDLQTLPKEDLVNYFDGTVDTFTGNHIVFNNNLIKTVPAGTALAVDYSFGTLFIDYNYVSDNIRISYEYGDNSIDFSISDSIATDDEYFVSYRYGALRNKLLTNFGVLTQVEDLGVFPLDFNRELYRDFIRGALASFVEGPTFNSISSLVETVTGIPPQIRELSFDEWTSDRDNLYLDNGVLHGKEEYAASKFGSGIVIRGDTTLAYPEEAYISHKEGTIETWIRPNWDGMYNDATLTFDIGQDGYSASETGSLLSTGMVSLSDIYIGAQGWHPTAMPFDLQRFDVEPMSPVGKPHQFGDRVGYFIWYDDLVNRWNMAWAADPLRYYRFTGVVTTSGEFYNVTDGYNYAYGDSYVESSDRIYSTRSYVQFDSLIDGYDALDGYDGYAYADGYIGDDGYTTIAGYLFHDILEFSSDNVHYIFDAGAALNHNRLSIFKDGSGFLNFRVMDDTGRIHPGRVRQYAISHDISDWVAGDDHFITAAWRFNSTEGIDEMHFGIDGQEVSNVLKFGGAPQAAPTDVFRSIADEIVAVNSPKKIIGGVDGITISTSNVFESPGSTFISDGIVPGDMLTILDPTADGAGSPYTIFAVISETIIQLTVPLVLDLTDVSFSINSAEYSVNSNIDVENFIVLADDGYTRRELNGLFAESPDYSIRRDGAVNILKLLKNIDVGDDIIINTLGLTKGRCRDVLYNYTPGSTIKTRLAPPADFAHFDIYKIIFMRTSIISGGTSVSASGSFIPAGSQLNGTFTSLVQPSNSVTGKKLKLTLGGTSNINFSGTNQVTINGTTFEGPAFEVISFTDYGTQTTTNHFLTITSIDMTFTGMVTTQSFGSIEVKEAVSFTRSENNGDYAQPLSYSNGRISFIIFGSGGIPFNVEAGYYQFDFPLSLNIPMKAKGRMLLGSDLDGHNQLDGVIDQIVILNEMLDDIRAGEVKESTRNITEDFNSTEPASITPQTLMLIDFDNKISNVDKYYKTFAEEYVTSGNSVNENFGDALVLLDNIPLVIDNSSGLLSNNAGTIEFWVSPYIDTFYDWNQPRYYFDMTSLVLSEEQSLNAQIVKLSVRAKSINSVRLINDDGTGTDYFERGELLADGTTIILGTKLPAQNTQVKIEYVPIDFNGERISLYKDGYGNFNFAIVANEIAYIISYPISWSRNTWHRVQASWKANSLDGKDRMRLFIDGVESGTITYGTPGLLWGSGIVYGQAAIGSLSSQFLAANIDLTDTFGDIVIGNSFNKLNPAKAKMDNLRFSSIAREPSVVANNNVDLNYNSNTSAALPVIEDVSTTALYNFDRTMEETEFLSNLLDENTPLYLFDVLIDDGFRRLAGNDRAKNLLITLIKRMKPSHANVFIKYLQDE